MKQINFKDLETLKAEISEEFGPWGPEIEVTQERINMFANATEDYQWIHVDVERAKRESPFRGPVAHGFLTLSLIPALKPPANFEITGYNLMINYGGEYRFMSPVPAGSRVHARARLASVETLKGGKRVIITTAVEVAVVGSEKPALVANIKVLFS
jgi:acyl dehydratase